MISGLGFRRIELVRFVLEGTTAAAEVEGVFHRHPCTVPVSLRTAHRLVTAGAPVRVERRDAPESGGQTRR